MWCLEGGYHFTIHDSARNSYCLGSTTHLEIQTAIQSLLCQSKSVLLMYPYLAQGAISRRYLDEIQEVKTGQKKYPRLQSYFKTAWLVGHEL